MFWLQYPSNRDFCVPALSVSLFQAKTTLALPTTIEVKKRPKINQNSKENFGEKEKSLISIGICFLSLHFKFFFFTLLMLLVQELAYVNE